MRLTPVRLLMLALGIALLQGCTSPPAARSTNAPALQIAPGPITSWQQYQDARNSAIDRARSQFLHLTGKQRLSAVVEALQQLPSAPSRRYATRLANALANAGIPVPAPPAAIPASTPISYEELATSFALTGCLGMEQYSPTSQPATQPADTSALVPYALYLELMNILAIEAPGDDTALIGAFLSYSTRDVLLPPGYAENGRIPDWSHTFALAMPRFTNPRRPLNLTSFFLFDTCRGTSMAMTVGGYAQALNQRDHRENTFHPVARRLLHDWRSAAKRSKAIFTTPEEQEILNSFIEDATYFLRPVAWHKD